MLSSAVTRSAGLSLDLQKKGTAEPAATLAALAYVKAAFPDAIDATPQATDEHMTAAIRSEVSRLVHVQPVAAVMATAIVPPIEVKAVGDATTTGAA